MSGSNQTAPANLAKESIANIEEEVDGRRDEIDFHHPYTPYDIQETFMQTVYDVLEKGGVGILESPTGTGKSLSLICGSLTWLRTFKARKFDEGLVWTGDADEPDWIIEQARARKRREMMRMREEMEERLKKVKEKEKRERDRYRKGEQERAVKKRKVEEKNDVGEDEFVLEDWDSDEGGKEKAGDTVFSSETLRLMEQAGMRSRVQEEEVEEDDELKIYYCSRTHSQLTQFINELRRVKLPPPFLPPSTDPTTPAHEDLKHLTLGSRKNLCINTSINKLHLPALNERCLDLQKTTTASAHKCVFLPTKETQPLVHDFRDHALASIRDIEDLAVLGTKLAVCPYYAARSAVRSAEVISLPYPLLLQEAARDALGVKLDGNVVIIDEAHNLMDAIAGIHSVEITLDRLKGGREQVRAYVRKFAKRLSGKNRVYVAQVVRILDSLIGYLEGRLAGTKLDGVVTEKDLLAGKGVDQINLFKLIKYLSESKLARKVEGYALQERTSQAPPVVPVSLPRTEAASPILHTVTALLSALTHSTSSGTFFFQRTDDSVTLKYQLLSPSSAFKSIVTSARAVILCGGTMSPFSDYYSHLFPYLPPAIITTLSCNHVIPPSSLYTSILSAGPSGRSLSFSFKTRSDTAMLADLGAALINICNLVPDGVVIFFPSYAFLASCLAQWSSKPTPLSGKKLTILERLAAKKPVFRESKEVSSDVTLADYSQAIDAGKGGLLLSVVGGKMSEGINFSDTLGRCVLIVGLPFPNINSAEWKAKLAYIESSTITRLEDAQSGSGGKGAGYGVGGNVTAQQLSREEMVRRSKTEAQDFYTNTCMRAVNQSIGRAIRHKGDYAAIVLVDTRYKDERIQQRLPGWIARGLVDEGGTTMGLMKGLGGFFRGKRTSGV